MQVQKEIGSEYGLYFALLNSTVILNVLLDLGMSNYNNRKVAINNERFSKYFQNISILRFGLAVAYMAILQVWGIIAGYESDDQWMLFLLGLSQVFLSSLLYIRSNFTAFGKFKLDSFFSVLDRILMIGGVLYLFSNKGGLEVNIENFIYVQVIGYGVSFILGLITLLLIGKPGVPKVDKRFSAILLRKSAPYALIVILMTAYHSSDAIMIERMLPDGEEEAAIYAQSMRILMALNNYAYLFAVLLLPMFTKLLARKQSVQSLITTSSSLLMYGVTALAIFLGFYHDDVIALCYGKFYDNVRFVDGSLNVEGLINGIDLEPSYKVFSLLIFGIIPMSVNYCFGALITASGNMKVLNKIAIVSLVLNIILNLVFIPQHGAYGAALASFITQFVSGIGQILFAVRLFKLEIKVVSVLRYWLGVSVVVISTLFLNEIDLFPRAFVIPILILAGLVIAVDLKGVLSMAKGFGDNKP